MPHYTISVELKGESNEQKCEELHGAMEKLGFYRTATGTIDSGVERTWNLPHTLYYGFSKDDVSKVRDKVSNTTSNIQSRFIVFVAETVGWSIANYG
jgi:hypothetical protein